MKEEKITLELTGGEALSILAWFNCWAATYHRDENGDFHVPQPHKELANSINEKTTEFLMEEWK